MFLAVWLYRNYYTGRYQKVHCKPDIIIIIIIIIIAIIILPTTLIILAHIDYKKFATGGY